MLTVLQGTLRTQDKELISQLNRCQDTIEAIKKQRTQFNENDELDEEEEGHWEDWEIAGTNISVYISYLSKRPQWPV